jgi:hypothetical protein
MKKLLEMVILLREAGATAISVKCWPLLELSVAFPEEPEGGDEVAHVGMGFLLDQEAEGDDDE